MNMNGQNSMIDTRLLQSEFMNETQHRRAPQVANISDDMYMQSSNKVELCSSRSSFRGKMEISLYVKTQINPIL